MAEIVDEDVAAIIGYFGGREPQPCVTCQKRPEARPGVRLCRTCLGIAAACHEAIAAEERAAELLERVRELPKETAP